MIKFRIDDELVIREFTEADAACVFAAVKDNYEHLKRFMIWSKPDYSLVDAQEFLAKSIEDAKKENSLGFGIFRVENLIGAIGFARFDCSAGTTEIGYWIDRREEGKGIILRASQLLIEYAFTELKLNRVEIRCSSENLRSAAIPERLGFIKEGVLRQSQFIKGKLHDFLVYGLLRSEWRKSEPPA